jgi:hypothetical protein
MVQEVKAAYDTADFPNAIRTLDKYFGQAAYSLKSLFKDEQRRILNEILASTREDLENRFRLITERYEPLVKFMRTVGAPSPPALETVFDMVFQGDIRRAIEAEKPDLGRLRTLLENARTQNGRVLNEEIKHTIKNRMERLMQDVAAQPESVERISLVEEFAEAVLPVDLGLNLWKVQDLYWELLQQMAPRFRDAVRNGESTAQEWLNRFITLGEKLGFAVQNLRVEIPKDVAVAA